MAADHPPQSSSQQSLSSVPGGLLPSQTLPVSSEQSINYISQDKSLYTIHKAVYENDISRLKDIIKASQLDIDSRDIHGNTPLHLAAILGHKECMKILFQHGATVNIKNLQGQTPLNESISYGDRPMIASLLHELRAQTKVSLEAHHPNVKKALLQLDDFRLTLQWEFHSWVPLVSRFLPCDTCYIYKKGCSIRMDTTLVDFKDMKWERGDLTFLFDGERLGSKALLVMDNEAKVYQWIEDQSDEIIDNDVDLLMSTDNETGKMSTKEITFSRARSGFIFKSEKTEMVGGFKADFYNIHGIRVTSIKRREHLSDEDVKRNRTKIDHTNIQKALSDQQNDIKDRQSLSPPPNNCVPWEEYWSAPAGQPPCLGRPIKCKAFNKTFQASVAMSDEFPVSVQQLLTVLESIKPLRHFKKLREFLTSKLPPGFPVKLEIPVFPTVTAKISFEDFAWKDDMDPSLFQVPKTYEENPERFKGL